MNRTTRNILFVIVLVAVVGAIWYIEGTQVHPSAPSGAPVIVTLPTSTTVSTSTGATKPTLTIAAVAAADKAAGDKPAIEIADPTGFINTAPFTLSSIVGKKVILLDFWTYSCINCLRTLPYTNSWYQKYAPQGLEIVGVHTPEFEFEKVYDNVAAAVQKYNIKYPVVLDSNYGTWNAYGNQYWPADYMIDIAGYVVHQSIGEGDYNTTESEIQQLLKQRAEVLGIPLPPEGTSSAVAALTPSAQSPETYFGAARNEFLANGTQAVDGVQNLTANAAQQANALYLDGSWNFSDQYATNVNAGAKVFYEYDAGHVYIVASAVSTSNPVTVEVLQDGVPLPNADAGADVKDGKVTITNSRLYDLINNPSGTSVHTLELIVDQPGLQAYTFTFG